jgi:hypothetical protein
MDRGKVTPARVSPGHQLITSKKNGKPVACPSRTPPTSFFPDRRELWVSLLARSIPAICGKIDGAHLLRYTTHSSADP